VVGGDLAAAGDLLFEPLRRAITRYAVVGSDPDTGTLEILNYSVMDDFGRALNPLLLQGQIHGAAR